MGNCLPNAFGGATPDGGYQMDEGESMMTEDEAGSPNPLTDAHMLTEEQIRMLVEHQMSLNEELDKQADAQDDDLEDEIVDDPEFIQQGMAAVREARERMHARQTGSLQPVEGTTGSGAAMTLEAAPGTPPPKSSDPVDAI